MRKTVLLVLGLAAVLGWVLLQGTAPGTNGGPLLGTGHETGKVRVLQVQLSAFDYDFSPNYIEAGFGDIVEIEATSADAEHGFSLPEFGVRESLKQGKTAKIRIEADKRGTFTWSSHLETSPQGKNMQGVLEIR